MYPNYTIEPGLVGALRTFNNSRVYSRIEIEGLYLLLLNPPTKEYYTISIGRDSFCLACGWPPPPFIGYHNVAASVSSLCRI